MTESVMLLHVCFGSFKKITLLKGMLSDVDRVTDTQLVGGFLQLKFPNSLNFFLKVHLN